MMAHFYNCSILVNLRTHDKEITFLWSAQLRGGILASHPAAPGSILNIPIIFLLVLQRFIRSTAQKSELRHDNVNPTHLVLASGKLFTKILSLWAQHFHISKAFLASWNVICKCNLFQTKHDHTRICFRYLLTAR